MSGLRVAVIGGGIGGCAAVLALQRAGCIVDVYEQVPVKGEVGAGIHQMRAGYSTPTAWRSSLRRSASGPR
jgi:salicylate hydroxylase